MKSAQSKAQKKPSINQTTTTNFNNKINININIKDNIIIDQNKSSDKIQQLINTVNNNTKSKDARKYRIIYLEMKIISVEKIFKNDNSSEENQSMSYSEQESKSPLSNSIEDEKISPQSFTCHALLGKGSFGEVYLVEKKNSKSFYAMKVLSKDRIMGS